MVTTLASVCLGSVKFCTRSLVGCSRVNTRLPIGGRLGIIPIESNKNRLVSEEF